MNILRLGANLIASPFIRLIDIFLKVKAGLALGGGSRALSVQDKSDRPLGKAILSSDRRAMEIVQRWQKEAVPQKLYPLTRQTL
ncbi:FGGY family carbohydrate kinase, partial [Salmonella enterica subsp. enterica serovar Kentucky]|nr:FGGY family carbohydrate kinase [Salmonella enterica subsp. enterica serovar Kentucky]